jgi:hypothetical protein
MTAKIPVTVLGAEAPTPQAQTRSGKCAGVRRGAPHVRRRA